MCLLKEFVTCASALSAYPDHVVRFFFLDSITKGLIDNSNMALNLKRKREKNTHSQGKVSSGSIAITS